MKNIVLLLTICFLCYKSFSQEIITLYPNQVPNSKASEIKETFDRGMYRGVTSPTLEYIKPEKPNGTAIIVIAGGGYGVIVYSREGIGTAKSLAENGISTFVLKYRLPSDDIMIDKNKIGVMGFSAGGHLASTAATHFEKSYINNPENTCLRPDFQILIYPVITMQDSLTHPGSRDALLGKTPSQENKDWASNEMQISSTTPITWLTHAADDKLVDVENSIKYFKNLRKNKVEVEMHIFPKGDHGFIFRNKNWMDSLYNWFKRNNLL